MPGNILTKDPTRLPCPRCKGEVDAGAGLRSLRLMRRQQLACPHCGLRLCHAGRYYWPTLPLALGGLFNVFVPLPPAGRMAVLVFALLAAFGLIGLGNAAARLEAFEEGPQDGEPGSRRG